MTQYEQKFRDILAEILQLDQAELDFGIYRIMNQKRKDIEAFLNNRLVPEVTKILKAQTAAGTDISAMENEVFSHLAKFFSRYYEGGDFISKRRYKDDAYAIPYSGEEVKLYWANADQYYIKTSEYFKNYSFVLPTSRRKVHFVLRDADTEQNNNKAANNMERRFQLCEEDCIAEEDGELNIFFTYELMPKTIKQDALIKDAEAKIISLSEKGKYADFAELINEKVPTEKNKERTLLMKHLQDYTAKNNFDYFIHKDLGGFLCRELDFYIKNEVMFLDDLDATHIMEHLAQVKAIKLVGDKIITFLAQLEDFQKKLWLKKKFVVGCDYCITLDRIPRTLYSEIIANDAQRQEWVRLFAIDEIKGDMMTEGYSEPLTEKFLEDNPFLVLDTKFFSAEFKHKLVGSMEKVDEECNGLLINSENFQALELLQEKYREAVKCVYIDPPYNTGKGDFYYKDNFQDSSWLTMMNERLTLAKSYLSSKSVLLMNMDEHEISNSEILASNVLEKNNDLGTIVWDKRNPKGDSKGIAYQHEYILTYAKDAAALAETCKVQRPKRNAELILSKAKQLFSKKSETYTFIIRKTKCFRPAKRNVQKAKRNVFVLDTLPNHIKIALERLSCQILTLFLSTYQCLSYHNLKALHISELQAAIFRCLEQLLLVNCLDGYLYLLVGKFLEILLGLLLLIEEVLIDLSELGRIVLGVFVALIGVLLLQLLALLKLALHLLELIVLQALLRFLHILVVGIGYLAQCLHILPNSHSGIIAH